MKHEKLLTVRWRLEEWSIYFMKPVPSLGRTWMNSRSNLVCLGHVSNSSKQASYISCYDCCIVQQCPCWSWAGCCCWSCAHSNLCWCWFRPFAPYALTFPPCAWGGCHRLQVATVVFLPQPLAQILHLCTWSMIHPLQLALVWFFLTTTSTDTVLAVEQFAVVVDNSRYHSVSLQHVF